MSVKRTAVAAALFFAGLALAGCGVAAGNTAPRVDPCALFAAAESSVSNATDAWVAAGKPAVSPLRDNIRAAVLAAPDLYLTAWAAAPESLLPDFGRALGASRQVAADLKVGNIQPESSNAMAIANWAANNACHSDA